MLRFDRNYIAGLNGSAAKRADAVSRRNFP
jgi:hypothetical protein